MEQPVSRFLELLAARTPAPGGGGAAAVTAALAAALAAMAGRFSGSQFPGADELAGMADRLRGRAAALADEDVAAYQAVLDAYALPREDGQRRRRVREALQEAAAVPLEIAEVAAQIAGLASRAAEEGNRNLRGDAVTAAILAEAAARSAACLVDINVDLGELDPDLSRRAARSVHAAQVAAQRAAATA